MNAFWLQQTESEVPTTNDWLGTDEASRLSGMSVPKRRAEWRLGRWTAKCAVAAYLKRPAEPRVLRDLEIRPASSGAPEIFISGQSAPFAISLSHRAHNAIAAVACSGIALGCDLELIEQHSDSFATDYFSDEEQRLVRSAPFSDRSALLTLLWSAKESALKAVREGLRRDTRSMLVNVPDPSSISGGGTRFPLEHANKGWHIPYRRSDWDAWHALQITDVSAGRMLQGWWQRSDRVLRTLVADPPLYPPVLLNLAICG